MHQPNGFEEPRKEGWVWKLKKVLYGLKWQGGHEWYHCIDDYLMTTLGLTHTFADHSVYVYETKDSMVLVPLYINDLLIGYCNEPKMEHIKSPLEQHFKTFNA